MTETTRNYSQELFSIVVIGEQDENTKYWDLKRMLNTDGASIDLGYQSPEYVRNLPKILNLN